MIDIRLVKGPSFRETMQFMRFPLNSENKSDSGEDYIGEADLELAGRLAQISRSEAKFRRMLPVYLEVTAPLYWWKEFDTYKVGTVANSTSTMHTIGDRPFSLDMFSHDHILDGTDSYHALSMLLNYLNVCRGKFLTAGDAQEKKYWWWQMIQLLPSSFNQKRGIFLNYEVLATIYKDRKNHKLDEWRTFCSFIETQIPYAWDLIIAHEKMEENKS